MTTNLPNSQAPAQAASRSSAITIAALILGWLVPGAGHMLLGKYIRGLLLLGSITIMFVIGIQLQGKVYTPNTGDLLDVLGFVGDLGSGILYMLARAFDWGHASVQIALADYGTKFIVVAGLLNIISAVDAHSLANGRKIS
ncbi:hypothetical protein SAMN05421770_104418 [Granulicella rosea]|uniref:DUF6677 domain-containing protein n=1 Tax=Granulicella rosea TaxID=474952 RepID=A0A239KB76_9BACT|nr:DUF6677 family protein [Granulicella rosea]SNT15315.1 hypothetical protein SAMN05421770_104418 [Granulicella rosea]